MGIEKDIQRLFAQVLSKYDGNKAAAAESLDVNSVTFWHWVTKTRNLPSTLCKAIDNAGGRLLLPGEAASPPQERDRELEKLRDRAESLIRENELLRKLVAKYETEEKSRLAAPIKRALETGPGEWENPNSGDCKTPEPGGQEDRPPAGEGAR